MSASGLVHGRQRTLGHAFADIFPAAERQRHGVQWPRRQPLRTFYLPKQHIRAHLRAESSAEAGELCKLHLKQQLVGVNRGIFGVKVRRLHIYIQFEWHIFLLCKY